MTNTWTIVLLLAGVVAVTAGVMLLAGPGWALVTGGVFALLLAVLLYDTDRRGSEQRPG